jgi:hypothetical protein
MRDGVCAELNVWAFREIYISLCYGKDGGNLETNFFIMTYLKALPRVWPSLMNSNEAAVSVEPGSYTNKR